MSSVVRRHLSRIPASIWVFLSVLCLAGVHAGEDDNEETDRFFAEWLRMDDLKEFSDIPTLEEWELEELERMLTPVSPWSLETRASGGGGYRDNVLLGTFSRDGGGFIFSGFETLLLRVGETTLFSFAVDGEHLHFTDSDLPNDTFSAASSQVTVTTPADLTLGLGARAWYFSQVISIATEERPDERIPVRGHGMGVNPSIRKSWPTNQTFTTLAGSATRQKFREPVHDFWEYGPRISAGWTPANSELSLSLEYLRRDHDDRRALTGDGMAIPDSDLYFTIWRPELTFRHHVGGASQWRFVTRAGYDLFRDNESDFFAYDRARISQQIRFQHRQWETSATGRFSRYDYKIQRTDPDGPGLKRDVWGAEFEVRRELTESIELFGRYVWEEVDSNDPASQYSVKTWTAGLTWRF